MCLRVHQIVGMASDCVQTIIRAFCAWTDRRIPEPVIDFIKEHKTNMMDSGEEMELDLNSLSNEQFTELLALVKSCSESRDQGFASKPVKTETHAAELERQLEWKKFPKKMRRSRNAKDWKNVVQSQGCLSGFRKELDTDVRNPGN